MDAYINVCFTRNDTPSTALDKITQIINEYLEDDALSFALNNKRYRLSVITSRARGLVAFQNTGLQRIGLAACFMLNFSVATISINLRKGSFFTTRPNHLHFVSNPNFRESMCTSVKQTSNTPCWPRAPSRWSLKAFAISTMLPRNISRRSLIDYHLSHQFAVKENDIVLFFHHQERIIPGWLDKNIKRRAPEPHTLNNVLMIFPSSRFVESLPGGKVPDRTDFVTFIDDPETRIKKWRNAVHLSAPLGEDFLELVESGKIRDVVETFLSVAF